MGENFVKFGDSINNAFYFVLNKIISIQGFFLDQAYAVGRIVLLIALLSAALNYALTGSGLKENLIKILKATLFFLIITAAYPRIIGWITNYTYDLAYGSVGGSVKKYFDGKIDTMSIVVIEHNPSEDKTLSRDVFKATPGLAELFKKMERTESPKVKIQPLLIHP